MILKVSVDKEEWIWMIYWQRAIVWEGFVCDWEQERWKVVSVSNFETMAFKEQHELVEYKRLGVNIVQGEQFSPMRGKREAILQDLE